MRRRAELAEALGDDAEALALAQQSARLNPSRRDIYATCARLAGKLGDLESAIRASRSALELVVPGDVQATTAARAELAELCRKAGDTIGAVYYFELVVAEEPHHARSLEALAELYVERGNWGGAARALRTLAELAGAPEARAALLYRLGELLLAQLGDLPGADDAFLRASDLDPTHVPTLRRLIDVYWRAGDVGALLDVAQDLARSGRLLEAATARPTPARTATAAATSAAMHLADRVAQHLDFEAAPRLAAALTELVGRSGEPDLEDAAAAVLELARRGHVVGPEAISAARALPGKAGAEVARSLEKADE
jgi:tetratricopeptide (TPR) repeat protein